MAGSAFVLLDGRGGSDQLLATYGYSGMQLMTVTTPAGHAWTLSYDMLGRLSYVVSPVSGTVGQAGYTPAYVTLFVYGSGYTQVIEGYNTPGQRVTTYYLDGQGQPVAVADGLGHTRYTGYDYNHDVLSSTDANGNTTTNYFYVRVRAGTG